MLKKIWLVVFFVLLIVLAGAVFFSPFVNSSGAFARFQHQLAISAGFISITGTLILGIWGWLVLRRLKG